MATFYFPKSNETLVVSQTKLANMTLAFRKQLQPYLVKSLKVKPTVVRTEKQAMAQMMLVFNKHKAILDGLYANYHRKDSSTTWTIKFADRMAKAAGHCRVYQRDIRISKQFALTVPKEELIDTVLHQIAHAYVQIETGSHFKPHGPAWKEKCQIIGCSGKTHRCCC